MATVNKDFKIKYGLVVEGTTGTINNYDILTKSSTDQAYIIGLIGGSAQSTNTPNTVVLRDANGDFAAGTITANLLGNVTGNVTGTVSSLSNHDTGDLAEGTNLYFTNQRAIDANTGLWDTIGAAAQALADAQTFATGEVTTHNNTTTGVHGVTGAVVGTTDAQTLTNKTLGTGTGLGADLDANGNKIVEVGYPTVLTDAANKEYVDDQIGGLDITAQGYADAAEAAANFYTDGEISALDSSLKLYADQAETDAIAAAKTYTDGREVAITTAYQGYADQAEADAISAAASSAASLYAPLTGATFTGEVLLAGDPTQALGAATKQYVDTVAAEGLHVQEGVDVATTGTLATISGGVVTYNNGSAGVGAQLSTTGSFAVIDDITLTPNPTMDPNAGGRVLVKNEANAAHNGIYYLTSTTVLTRDPLFDSDPEIEGGDFVFVVDGTLNGGTGWVQTATVNVIGTDAIVWDQFSGAGTYSAGTGLTLTGTQFAIDETYTATKSYVDGEISDLDTSLKAYADQAEADANAYTNTRETAITNAYQAYADQAETDAKAYADGVAATAETNAKAYTDGRETAITAAYQDYADQAELDANIYTDNQIDALTTNAIEEGDNNLYFTDERAQDAIGAAIAAGTQTNITVTYNDEAGSISFVAENGIADSTTDDLEEGLNNLYFTDARAQAAVAGDIASAINALDTDDIEEGSANLYFTNERAQAAVATDIANAVAAGDATATPSYEAINFNDVAMQVAATTTVETASTVIAYQFAAADFRTAEFLVKFASGTHTEVSKVILTLDTLNNVSITEYAIVGTNGSLGDISATVSSGNVDLNVTTANNNTVVVVAGTLLK